MVNNIYLKKRPDETFEQFLRRFSEKVRKEHIIPEAQKSEFFTPRSQKHRRKKMDKFYWKRRRP